MNQEYKKLGFKLSDLQTDQVAIASCGGEYAGVGRLCKVEDRVFELGGMYVLEAYRELGIARMIVKFLLESASKNTTLYCLPFAHLHPFYKSEGFQEVEEQDLSEVPKEILEKHRWCNQTYPHKVLLLSQIV